MWKLAKSRGQFSRVTGLNVNNTIWSHVANEMVRHTADSGLEHDSVLDLAERLRELERNGDLARSNCPVVAELAEDLIAKCPAQWKAVAKNVYFGVTLQGEPGALSFNYRDAGVVQISVQYVWLLEAYVRAFDEYLYGLRRQLDNWVREGGPAVPPPAGGFAAWRRLEQMVHHWRDESILYVGPPEMQSPAVPGRRTDEIDAVVNAAQEWTMAHEMAHHFLGHTVRQPRARVHEANQFLDRHLPEYSRRFIDSYTQNHRDELRCDALAFLLVLGIFKESPSHGVANRAVFGSAMALVSLSHCTEHWVGGESVDSHPAMQDRWQSLILLAESLFATWARDPRGAHPLDALNQLRVFMDVALTYWITSSAGLSEPEDAEGQQDAYEETLLHYYIRAWEQRIGDRFPVTPDIDLPVPPERRHLASGDPS